MRRNQCILQQSRQVPPLGICGLVGSRRIGPETCPHIK